jgi:hypothetical protein
VLEGIKQFAKYKEQGVLLRANRYLRRILVLRFSDSTAGLGDQIWHTHLPRAAKASGAYRRVVFSTESSYRHPGMFEVLWRENPYIDEFVTGVRGFSFVDVGPVPGGSNKLDQIMNAAFIEDGHRWHEPEVYSQFEPIPELQGKVLYDPNFVTEAGDVSSEQVLLFMKRHGIAVDFQFAPRWRSYPLPNVPTLVPNSLEWFCRAIVSASALYCFTTGTASLAPALKRKASVLYGEGVSTDCHHSRLNDYIKI